MIRTTSSPASSPASRVACRWPSLKKAGTVITAFETGWPSAFSARCLSVRRMIAEISCGVYFWSPRVTVDLLAHLPLDRPDRPFRGQDVLVARGLADQQVALRVQADDRRQDRVAVLVGQDDRPAVADDRHLAVGRPQVDADDRLFRPCCPSLRSVPISARRAARLGAAGLDVQVDALVVLVVGVEIDVVVAVVSVGPEVVDVLAVVRAVASADRRR